MKDIQVNDMMLVTIPFSSETYLTECIAIEVIHGYIVLYGADGTRCKDCDAVKSK